MAQKNMVGCWRTTDFSRMGVEKWRELVQVISREREREREREIVTTVKILKEY